MNMIFASERERQMMLLRKNKLKQVLNYNLYEIERKRNLQEYQKHQFENAYQTMASQALENMHEENRKKSMRRQSQKNMLKDTYQKQMRDKEQRARLQKMKDRQYFDRQKAYSEYEEARRMIDLQKMFDRITYQGVPTPVHRRTKTQAKEKEFPQFNPEPPTFYLPNVRSKPIKTEGSELQHPSYRYQQKFDSPQPANKNTLDNIYVESFQKPSKGTPQKST